MLRTRRWSGGWALTLLLGATALLCVPAVAGADVGDLRQKSGTVGCVVDDPPDRGWAGASGLASTEDLALSPDGRSAYVTSPRTDALILFDRNPINGALARKPGAAGCLSIDTRAGTCTPVRAFEQPRAVAVSPDGRSVYVGTLVTTGQLASPAIAILDRDPISGALTQPGNQDSCLSLPAAAAVCRVAESFQGAEAIVASPDGRSLYAGSSHGISIFDRGSGGGLTQKAGSSGCVSAIAGIGCRDGRGIRGPQSLAISPDGGSVYAGSFSGDAVAIFNRNRMTGGLRQKAGTAGCISERGGGSCRDGRALHTPLEVTVSHDGRSVYVASFLGAVAAFDRDRRSGSLSQRGGRAGCITSRENRDGCRRAAALNSSRGVAASPDGRSLYVASNHGLAVLERDRSSGRLSQSGERTRCLSDRNGLRSVCRRARVGNTPRSVAISHDGASVYATSFGDLVSIFDRQRP